jgi:hypothetical protein
MTSPLPIALPPEASPLARPGTQPIQQNDLEALHQRVDARDDVPHDVRRQRTRDGSVDFARVWTPYDGKRVASNPLVIQRGWSLDEWKAWVAESAALLLR